ncbi:Vgb family protein [Actinomadura harenae]|uniref:Virginiamycin B lyase n=1 Tax=Actinomadura harenae TaxID=2483351 RepID=A0A3M2M735_9ACTN|nr:hypothetical protein [Actinomadura harenae]RMI44663.1 hypothetical protein EBO15_11935 [Actinomadura harenae]
MRRRRNRAAAVALTAVLGTAPVALPSAAHAADATEFGLSIPDVTPTGVAAASGGGAWFTESQGGIGRVTTDGKITEYPIPRNSAKGTGFPDAIATASDGAVWFTDVSGMVPRVGRVDPASGAVATFEPSADALPGAQISGIAAGANGAMWFTTGYNGSIVKITASGSAGVLTTFATGLSPYSVTVGPDQAVWFTSLDGQIGRLDPATGAVTTYAAPGAMGGAPAVGEITSGGGKVWFTEPGNGKIGSVDPASGQISEFAVPTSGARPTGLTVSQDGAVWFTESSSSNLGKLDPSTGQISEYPLPATLSGPFRVTVGADGKIWYSAPGRGRVGYVDPADPPSGFAHSATPGYGPGFPTMVSATQNRCPSNSLCISQVTTGGNTKIGSFALDLPPAAIRITGYIGNPDSTGNPVLNPPVSGKQFEGTPVEVPGGLIGQLPLIGPILGKTPAAMWDVNKLTVSQTLAGPVHVLQVPGGFGAQASLNIHLNNTLLGSNCVIGPVQASLSPTFTGGSFLNDPQLGWSGGQMEINAPIAIPKASGCGPFGLLDGVINQMMGLPSPAANNSMNLTGILTFGIGANASNVPDGLKANPSNPTVAKLRSALQAKKHATKPAAHVAKKHTYNLKSRH